MLEEALVIARELGMKSLRERVERFIRLAGRTAGIENYPAGLTNREVDVPRLVA